MQRKEIQRMIDEEYSIRKISRETGKAATTVRYWLDKYGLKTKCCTGRGVKRWTEKQMRKLLTSSSTIADVLKKIGLSIRPGNYDTVRKFIKNKGIDISHMTGKASGRGGNKAISKDVFVVNSRYGRYTAKRIVLRDKLLKNECAICGQIAEWKGKPLVMILDHINGVNNDHRIKNVRFLCPNCNSQQDTFCSRNRRKHSDETVVKVCVEHGAKEASKMLGLSEYWIGQIVKRNTKRKSPPDLAGCDNW